MILSMSYKIITLINCNLWAIGKKTRRKINLKNGSILLNFLKFNLTYIKYNKFLNKKNNNNQTNKEQPMNQKKKTNHCLLYLHKINNLQNWTQMANKFKVNKWNLPKTLTNNHNKILTLVNLQVVNHNLKCLSNNSNLNKKREEN